MTTIAEFRAYATENMMELESILAEVYTAIAADLTGFAMFDGGAHKAYHTLRMLALPGCTRVHAVEADPFMADVFTQLVEKKAGDERDRIIFHQQALQDDPRTASILWKSSKSHVGRSSIKSRNPEIPTIWRDNGDMVYREEMTVPATTIDRILASETLPVPFLKTDLEGADLLALKGASETLEIKRPVIAFENSIHAPQVHGFTMDAIRAYFQRLRYVPMNFIGEPLSPESWFDFFEAWLVPYERTETFLPHLREAIKRRFH